MGLGGRTYAGIYIIVCASPTIGGARTSSDWGGGRTSIHRTRTSVNRARASIEWGGTGARSHVNANARLTSRGSRSFVEGRRKERTPTHMVRTSDDLACAATEWRAGRAEKGESGHAAAGGTTRMMSPRIREEKGGGTWRRRMDDKGGGEGRWRSLGSEGEGKM